jgi:hypothetical protein
MFILHLFGDSVDDVEGHLKLLTKKIEKNGKRYLAVDKIRFNFEVKK